MQNFICILSSWRWQQWHKEGATLSGNLVEICDSLGNLDLCVLHLKRTMHGNSKHHINELVRMKFLAFSNDIICTAILAHSDHVTLTMCWTTFQEQQPWIQATTSVLWTKSMWAHGAAWLVKISSHEQLTITLAMHRSSLSDGFSTVENWMHSTWLHSQNHSCL